MRLSELIEETLSEIAIGVKSAKEKSRKVLAIAPGTLNDKLVAEITYIEFDVSIVVAENSAAGSSNEKGLGGEIKVLSVGGLGGSSSSKSDKSDSSSSQLSHRITFKVPICMSAEFNVK